MKKALSILLCIVMVISCFQTVAYGSPNIGNKSRNYLVKFRNSSDKEKIIKRISEIGGKFLKNSRRGNILTTQLNDTLSKVLKSFPGIEMIEPDYEVEINSDTVPEGLSLIGADTAHHYNETGQGVKVAVMDTGVSNHSDLQVSGGMSFVNNSNTYFDDNGHGTHTAGIIAAQLNSLGIVGVAPQAELYSLKVLDNNGRGNYSSIIDGIQWAIDNDIDVINMSFGGGEYSAILEDAINQAYENGILIVASAGNNGSTISYPARYDKTIAVGAVDSNLNIAQFSGRGSGLDFVAPGVDVESTYLNNSYTKLSGTSMAAPHVSGAIALLWGKNKFYSNVQIESKLFSSATYLGDQTLYGNGLINIPGALDVEPVTDIITPPGSNVDENFNILSTNEILTSYQQKLRTLTYIANESGNIELAKEIDNKLRSLIDEDKELRRLPEDSESESENELTAQSAQVDINKYYSTKSEQFSQLESKYKTAVEGFISVIPELKPVEVNERSIEITNDNAETKAPPEAENFVETDEVIDYTVHQENEFSKNDINSKPAPDPDDLFVRTDDYVDAGESEASFNKEELNSPDYFDIEEFYIQNNIDPNRADVESDAFAGSIYEASPIDIYGEAGTYSFFRFTPVVSGSYRFYTGPYGGYGGNCDTVLELYRDGILTSLMEYNDDYNGTPFSSISVFLTAGAEYYIKVRQYSNQAYNTRLTVSLNVYSSYIGLNSPIDVSLPAGLYNSYEFVPSTTGQYRIYTSSYGGYGATNDTYLEVYANNTLTSLIAANDDYDGTFSSITLNMNAGIPYYIKLRTYNSSTPLYTRLTVASATSPASSIYLNSPVDVSLSTGAYKVYQFTPTTSRGYNIFTGKYAGTGVDNDTVLEVYSDPSLTNMIAYSDDANGTHFSHINMWMNGYVTYYIKIRTYSSTQAVYARLTIDDNTYLPIDLTGVASVSLMANESFVFIFTPRITENYSIVTSQLYGSSGLSDTYLELFTDMSLTNRVAYNDDYNGVYANIFCELNAGQTYYIRLKGYNNGSVSCQFQIHLNVSELTFLNGVDVYLQPGQSKLFKFKPNVDQSYRIFTSPYGGTGLSNDTVLEVYTDPNLTNMCAYDDNSGGSLFSRIEDYLYAGMTYYVKLSPRNPTGIVQSRITVSIPYLPIDFNGMRDMVVDQSTFMLFKYIPTQTGIHTIYTSSYLNNGSYGDTYLELYSDEYMNNILEYNDDYNGTRFSSIDYYMTAGIPYYIKIMGYNYSEVWTRLQVKTPENMFLTDADVYAFAKYYVETLEGAGYRTLNEKVALYNEQGELVAYAVPFVNSSNARAGHVNIGARIDGLSFYIVDKSPDNYSNISNYSSSGYKVIYMPLFSYYYNPSNPQLTGLAGYMQESEIDNSVKGYYSEENRINNTRLLERLRDSEASIETITTYAAHTNAMLKSEENRALKYVPIYGNDSKEYYGGNQSWWENYPPKTARNRAGEWMEQRGCGPTAFANIIAYYVGKDYTAYSDLLKYTDEKSLIHLYENVFVENPNYKNNFTKTFSYNISAKSFTQSEYIKFMDFYADLADIPALWGMLSFDMKRAFDELKYMTGFNYSYATPSDRFSSTVENFIINRLNADVPVLMFALFVAPLGTELNLVPGNKSNFDNHWMTVTKYFKDGNTGETFIAISSWGERYSVNTKLLVDYGEYRPSFYTYEILKK